MMLMTKAMTSKTLSQKNDCQDLSVAMPADLIRGSPESSESDSYVHVEYPPTTSPQATVLSEVISEEFQPAQPTPSPTP